MVTTVSTMSPPTDPIQAQVLILPYVSVTSAYRRVLMDIREMDRFLDDIHLNADDYITAMKDTYVPNIRTSLNGRVRTRPSMNSWTHTGYSTGRR